MNTRHLRLSIDFHITIADAPPLLPEGTLEPPDVEYDGRQARLLEAVKNQPDVLRRWMLDLIVHEMDGRTWGYWENILMGGEAALEEMLAPALATLSPDDQEYFAECVQLGVIEECTDMFRQSFTITGDHPVVEEMNGVRVTRTPPERLNVAIESIEDEFARRVARYMYEKFPRWTL